MSMREYATNSYGLVLDYKEAKEFGERYMQINDPKKYQEEQWDEATVDDWIDYLRDILIWFSDFVGEAMKIMPNGNDDWGNSIMYYSDCFGVLELNCWPSLFSQAYKSYDDLLTKLKEAYNKYFPEDFNYEDHLRHVVGTVWG